MAENFFHCRRYFDPVTQRPAPRTVSFTTTLLTVCVERPVEHDKSAVGRASAGVLSRMQPGVIRSVVGAWVISARGTSGMPFTPARRTIVPDMPSRPPGVITGSREGINPSPTEAYGKVLVGEGFIPSRAAFRDSLF
jgi:hypothetical protein